MFYHHSYFSSEQIADFRHFIAENRQNTELIISRLMLSMGFKMHLCGSIYLREAIYLCCKMPADSKISLNGTVYPRIAQKYDSSSRNVDRNIRTAIQTCYQNESMFAFNDICGCDALQRQYPPTNSEFILQIVAWIQTFENDRDMR